MTRKYKRHVRTKQRKLKRYTRVKTRQRGGLNPQLLKETLLFARASAKIALHNARKIATEKGINLKPAIQKEITRAFNIAQTEVMSGNPAKDFDLTSAKEYFKNSNWPKCSNKIYIFLTKAFIKKVGGNILKGLFGITDAEKAKLSKNPDPSAFNQLDKKTVIYRPIMTPTEETNFFGSPQSCPVITDTEIETIIAGNAELNKIMAEIFDINIELEAVKQEIELDPAELEDEINEQTKRFMIKAGIGRSIEEINAKGRYEDPREVDGGRRKPRHYKKTRRSKVM